MLILFSVNIMANSIWKAHAEGKLNFFTWLTADKLALRHWPCNPICPLCGQDAETAVHLCIHFPFAKRSVDACQKLGWRPHYWHWQGRAVQTMKIWWEKSLQGRSITQQRTTAAILMYSAWNIWKERNQRTFEGTTQTPAQVLRLIKEELGLFSRALGKIQLPPWVLSFMLPAFWVWVV